MRAAVMAQKTNMRLIGAVENMTGDVFGRGGGAALAHELGVPLLGRGAARPAAARAGRPGTPLVLADPESPTSRRSSRSPRRSTARAASRASGSSRRSRRLPERRGVLRPRPDAAATLEHARARAGVPPARRDHARAGGEGGVLAAALRRARDEQGARARRVRGGPDAAARVLAAQMQSSSPRRSSPCSGRSSTASRSGSSSEHRERGEPSYIVSAALQEVVDAMADDLGFDGALGTVCEVEDGVYTGRGVRSLHGENKAAAVRELAAGARLRPRYVDGVLGQPHRPAVPRGRRKPVAVNPTASCAASPPRADGRC